MSINQPVNFIDRCPFCAQDIVRIDRLPTKIREQFVKEPDVKGVKVERTEDTSRIRKVSKGVAGDEGSHRSKRLRA